MQADSKRTLLLALLAVVLAFSFQGSRGLYESTEGRYAEAGREMLETGNWLVPQLDYAPHWTKPPFGYWTVAAGIGILGRNEWGARFGDALLFVLTTLAVASLGRSMWDERTGFASGMIYSLSPFVVFAASSVHTDLLLSFWELLAVLCYWKGFRGAAAAGGSRWILGMWASLGCGFLTKGPPSLVVLAAFLAFHLYLRATGRQRPALFPAQGIALMLVIGFGWFLYVVTKTPDLLGYFLRDEVYGRIATSMHGRNPEWYKPLPVFVAPLLLGTGPAAAAWPLILAGEKFRLLPDRVKALLREDERWAFLALWLVVPLAIFSLAHSRLPLYILPIFPAVVLATGRALLRLVERPGYAKKVRVAVVATAALLIALKGGSAYYRHGSDIRPVYRACTMVSGGRTAYFLYGADAVFGLQFYLDGRLTRLADGPLPPWARRDIASVIREIVSGPGFDTYVIVTDAPANEKKLEERLDAAALAYKVVREGEYAVCAVRPHGKGGAKPDA